jgi:molecular chaperone DnaK
VSGDEKAKIEAALKNAEEAMKSDDKAKIEAATQALAESAHKLAEQMYSQEQAKQQQSQGAGAQSSAGASQGGAKQEDDGNVVDAEYEEVKDKK